MSPPEASPTLSPAACRLAEEHLPLVRRVLASVAANYPAHADREELAQAAVLGLVEAAGRFDPTRGVPFGPWATLRIRGAVLDAVRSSDFAPRSVRAAARDLERHREDLQGALGRPPSEAELAARAGTTVEGLAALRTEVHRGLVLRLDLVGTGAGSSAGFASSVGASGDGGSAHLADLLVDSGPEPSLVVEARERGGYVRDALQLLPERLREIVIGYFLDGESSADLAERLQVSESRISQLRSEALSLLRAGIAAQYAENFPELDLAPATGEPDRRVRGQRAFAAALTATSTHRGRLAVPLPRCSAPEQPVSLAH